MKKFLVLGLLLVGCHKTSLQPVITFDAGDASVPHHGPIGSNYPFPSNQIFYDAAVPSNWSPAPTNVAQGLDQLAARPAGGGGDSGVQQLTNDVIADGGGYSLVVGLSGTPNQTTIPVRPVAFVWPQDAGGYEFVQQDFDPTVADAGQNGHNAVILAQNGQRVDGGQGPDGGDVFIYGGKLGPGGFVTGSPGTVHLGNRQVGDLCYVNGGDGQFYCPGIQSGGNPNTFSCVHMSGIGKFAITSGDCANSGANTFLAPFVTPPIVASLTQINFGGSTTAVDDRGTLYAVDPGQSATGSRRLLMQAAPGVPFTFTVLVSPDLSVESGTPLAGIAVASSGSTPQFMEYIEYLDTSGPCLHMQADARASPTGAVTHAYNDKCGATSTQLWLQMKFDGTKVTFFSSNSVPTSTGALQLQFDAANPGGEPVTDIGGTISQLGIDFQSISATSQIKAAERIYSWQVTTP